MADTHALKNPTAWQRDVFWVAWNDFTGSIRSRRTIMLIVLFTGMIMLFGWHIIRLIEDMLAGFIGLDNDDPAALAAFWNSREYTRLARRVLGRRLQAGLPLDIPPIAWIFGASAFTLTPVLVAWTSAPRIAEEIGNRGVRFIAVRTSRCAWCLGKFLGQAAQLLLALLAAGLGMWLLAWNHMSGFQYGTAALNILRFSMLVWVWGLAFLGLATGLSQLTARHYLATMTSMLALMGIARVHRLAELATQDKAAAGWEYFNRILPTGYYYDLWSWNLPHLLPAVVMLLTLALLYLFAGYTFLARRDL